MTYDEAMKFIKETEKLGSVLGLESISNLLERLGNPQDRLKIVHVAGTNGKGSTIAFISGILASSGYRVGLYISPVVFSYREKIQIVGIDKRVYDRNVDSESNTDYNQDLHADTNNIDMLEYAYISEENICQSLDTIKAACDDMVLEGLVHPTAFEIETAMAFLYLLKEQVDFLILETGMGGRLDATNVISSPICSVITPVSLDHMNYLGNTLEQIANEKAGIMKANSLVITANQEAEVLKVFKHKADGLGIPFIIADSFRAKNIICEDSSTSFDYPNSYNSINYKTSMLGKYQVQNAILAIETARVLSSKGYTMSEEAISKGVRLAKWHGRFERISKAPDIYIDGAHNEQAALTLRDSIEIYFTNRRLIFMIGVLADKDYKGMLGILAPLADAIITLTPNNTRALASDILANEARRHCKKVYDEKDIEHALKRAYLEAGPKDVIVAFGSLSFLGSLVSSLKVRKDEKDD
jgi:dihydrofolate synthase/folylpolyglutamate synthase